MARRQHGFPRTGLPPTSRRAQWLGLALGIGIAAMFMVVLLAFQLGPRRSPAERVYGQVLTVEVVVRKASGARTMARVRTADGERSVAVPSGRACQPGDRIELWKRGTTYTSGLGGCARSQSPDSRRIWVGRAPVIS